MSTPKPHTIKPHYILPLNHARQATTAKAKPPSPKIHSLTSKSKTQPTQPTESNSNPPQQPPQPPSSSPNPGLSALIIQPTSPTSSNETDESTPSPSPELEPEPEPEETPEIPPPPPRTFNFPSQEIIYTGIGKCQEFDPKRTIRHPPSNVSKKIPQLPLPPPPSSHPSSHPPSPPKFPWEENENERFPPSEEIIFQGLGMHIPKPARETRQEKMMKLRNWVFGGKKVGKVEEVKEGEDREAGEDGKERVVFEGMGQDYGRREGEGMGWEARGRELRRVRRKGRRRLDLEG